MRMDASAFVAEPELIEALQQHASPVICDRGTVLFKQGDTPRGLYIFHAGEVRLTMRSDTGRLIMDMPALRGSLLGLPGLIGGADYSLSAFAMGEAEVSFLSRDKFDRQMLMNPSISMMILRVLAAEVRTARMAMSSR